MTKFNLGDFSCRAECIGEKPAALVLLFSGFERELFGDICNILSGGNRPLVLAEFGAIDWDNDYTPWEAEGFGGRHFGGRAVWLSGGHSVQTQNEELIANRPSV